MYLQFATAIPCFSFATRFTEKDEQCPFYLVWVEYNTYAQNGVQLKLQIFFVK